MTDQESGEGLRGRLTRQGEDAIGKLAQELLENPVINAALSRAFEAREKAAAAQEVAMNALNIPSAADIERLTRRVRSVSQRLEGIEDGVDRLDASLRAVSGESDVSAAIARIETGIAEIARELGALRDALSSAAEPMPRDQETLRVGEPGS